MVGDSDPLREEVMVGKSPLVSQRCCTKPPMQWSKRGAQRSRQTRIHTRNRALGTVGTRWDPDMAVEEFPDAASSPGAPGSRPSRARNRQVAGAVGPERRWRVLGAAAKRVSKGGGPMQKKTFDRARTGLLVLLIMAAGLLCPSGNPAGAAASVLQELKLRVAVYEREDRNAPPLVVQGIIRLWIDPTT